MDQDEREYAIGVRLFREGRILEALEHLREAATTGVDRPMEHFALAAALVQAGRLAEAREEFETYLRMAPEDPKRGVVAREAIAQIDDRLPTPPAPAAEPAPEPAVEDVPAPEPSALKLALSAGLDAYAQGRWDDAIAAFQAALDELGPNASVFGNLARCHAKKGELGAAVETFDRALALGPDDAGLLVGKAAAVLELGFREAIGTLEAAVHADPGCFEAHMNLGSVFYMRGNIGRARTCWRRAQKIDPQDPQLLRNLRSV